MTSYCFGQNHQIQHPLLAASLGMLLKREDLHDGGYQGLFIL
jgi:hypothetical protein